MHLAPLSFDASTFEIWCPLLSGGCIAVAPEHVMTSSGLERFIAAHRVSVMWLTASLFNTLVDDEPAALKGLKCLLTGGEALSVPHVQRALAALPGVRLINGYGPTETTTFACCHPIEPDEIAGASSVPIGRPIANTRVYVLDADGRMIRPGEAGELWIGGDGVAIGYLNDPQLTALRFTEDPFVPDPEARMYRSGDRARFRGDGTLEFLGRLDEQIKIRGIRIEPGEVEAAIAQHPGVARVAVVAADLPTVGRTLAAFVVLSSSAPTDGRSPLLPHGLREELRARLPEFMVPAIWVGLDALPLTATGKVDRRALSLLAGERRPTERPALPSPSQTEHEIAGIWQTVLGVEAPDADANFFFLGGHSLLATQVLSRIETALGVAIDLRTFFSRPTVSGLAAAVRRSSSNGSRFDTIPVVSRDQDPPLSYAQQRIWFLQRWYGNSGVYNVPMAVRLDGPADLDALTTALEIVVHRHESLRTVFPIVGKQPVQRVLHDRRLNVQRVDLSELDPDAATAAAQAQADAETHRPFDLEHELPIRATILRLSTETSVLLLTLHHIVCDGWSLEILFREISVLYAEARCHTTATSLQPLAIQYPDFAAWQRRYLMGDVLEGHLSYWRKQLHPPLPALELRPDRERPAESTARGGRVTFDAGEAIGREASRFSSDEGVTLFMTLLTAYQAVLHRYTGQQDMCVGTPVANRTRPEIEGLIGCFINTLVMRADLSGNPSFRSLARRTSEAAIDAQAHQDLPFELLVDALQVTRSANRSPLFQAMFALQDGAGGLPSLDGVTVTRMKVPFDYAKFEWTLHVRASAGGLGGTLEYNADLFDRTTADGFVRDFTALLEMALAEPDRPLADFPLEGADARHRYQHAAPDETVRVEGPATASGLLERAAAIERRLEPLWREVLGVTRVDVHDNFFDLGGNSLIAIRLFAMLEDCFGTKLPLSTLFGGGTIESQARLLAAGAMNAESASPLVPIHPLGTRPPFFLVHGIGGEVLAFAALAKHLGPDQPIFGLRAGRYESIDEDETIEVMATRYIAAMRERSPDGPYLLGGYSSGGIIAFEMAQQLRAAGEDVALLVMLDGPAPQSGRRALTPSTVWHMVKNVASWPLDDQFFKQGWATQRARLRAKVKSLRTRTRHGGTTAALAAGADVRALLGLWGMSDDATRFVQHHLGMRVRYQPRAYDGVVTVFRARTLSLGYRGAPDLGWSRLARGGVTLHSIPGAHDTILKEPRVQRLAAIVGDSLRDAQRGPATGVEDRLAEPSKLTHS
jgi:non-ribosomal peptide synthetase component F/thioesterase domain-containing protein/acyl carrier protein